MSVVYARIISKFDLHRASSQEKSRIKLCMCARVCVCACVFVCMCLCVYVCTCVLEHACTCSAVCVHSHVVGETYRTKDRCCVHVPLCVYACASGCMLRPMHNAVRCARSGYTCANNPRAGGGSYASGFALPPTLVEPLYAP